MSSNSSIQSPDLNSVQDPSSLLSLLSQNLNLEEFTFQWLEVQCASLPTVSAAVLLMREPDSNVFKPMAKCPYDASVVQLAEIAHSVIDEQCGMLVSLDDSDEPAHAAAYPIMVSGELQGIVALQIDSTKAEDLEAVMGQLQWSTGWLSLFQNQQSLRNADSASIRSKRALAQLSKVQAQTEYSAACLSLVTTLAADLNCDRVSIGFPAGDKIKVQAVSHTAQFGKRMELLSAIGHAMNESMIMGRDIAFPQQDSDIQAPDHYQLFKAYESQALVSIPIYIGDRHYCVLTLERNTAQIFTQDEIEFVRAVAVLCAPTLQDKHDAQRPLPLLIKDKFLLQLHRLFGADYIGRKVLVSLCVLLILFFTFVTGTYRVTADTKLEGRIQRVIAAPFNGYLLKAPVHAGDIVKAGQLVSQMDDRELRLQRQKWLSESSQYRHEYNSAYAKQERSEVNINRAQMNQAAAELALTEEQLTRSKIVAPFDGVVISGDLSQRLGAFVEQGEVLFEIAPLNDYRVILQVEDNRIGDVKIGQQGMMVLSSMPSKEFKFEVTTITPVTESTDGANYFRVEASLLDNSLVLRPGMEGIGKIEVDERLIISIWTRSFSEWLRLLIWEWFP